MTYRKFVNCFLYIGGEPLCTDNHPQCFAILRYASVTALRCQLLVVVSGLVPSAVLVMQWRRETFVVVVLAVLVAVVVEMPVRV